MLFETYFRATVGIEGIRQFERNYIPLPTGRITSHSVSLFIENVWYFLLNTKGIDRSEICYKIPTAAVCGLYLNILTSSEKLHAKFCSGEFCFYVKNDKVIIQTFRNVINDLFMYMEY